MTAPAARPYSAEKLEVLTWNSLMAAWGVEYPMRVRPRSSEKKAWLLSAPSTVLLLRRTLMPRRLIRPKPLELLTALGVRRVKLDQRPPLIGRFSIAI